ERSRGTRCERHPAIPPTRCTDRPETTVGSRSALLASHAAQIPIWKPPSRDLDRDPKGSETAARRPLRGGRGGGRGPLEYPAIGEGDGSTAIVSSASRRERFGAPGHDGYAHARGPITRLGLVGSRDLYGLSARRSDLSAITRFQGSVCGWDVLSYAAFGADLKSRSCLRTAQTMRAILFARATAAVLAPEVFSSFSAQARRRSGSGFEWAWEMEERAPWMRSVRR